MRAAAPSKDDLRREAGAVIEEKANGDWIATVPREHIPRAVAMMNGRRKLLTERGEKVLSRREKETALTADCREVSMAPHNIERYRNKKGLHAKVSWGRGRVYWINPATGESELIEDRRSKAEQEG